MRKLLIVKLGAIGDVLRTTALLPGLQEKYQPAAIDWVVAPAARELLQDNPYLHTVYAWAERPRSVQYDLVIGLEDDLASRQYVSSLGGGATLGATAEGYTASKWFDMSAISQYGLAKANQLKLRNRQTFQQHMAELLGIKVAEYVFTLQPKEKEWGRKTVAAWGIKPGDKVLGVNTGAGQRWLKKSWGVENTIDLINRVREQGGIKSITLGGPEETERDRLIAQKTNAPQADHYSLRQFAAIIEQCPVLLSSDSLAMHFGIALKKRVIAFFGPTSAAEIELYGRGEKLTSPLDCLVCYQKECGRQPDCMVSLTVEQVAAAVERQFNG